MGGARFPPHSRLPCRSLSQLLKAEMAEREVPIDRVSYEGPQRFPAYKDLLRLRFCRQRKSVNPLVRQLHRCEFLDGAENVVADRGAGNREIPCLRRPSAFRQIEHHRKRVRFFSTVELVNALEQEKAPGQGREDRRSAGEKLIS